MSSTDVYDVLIAGAGPAGMTAAMWCVELGMGKVLLLEEKNELGGQLNEINNRVDNYPGIRAANGKEIRDLFLRSLEPYSLDILLNTHIDNIDLLTKRVQLNDGDVLTGRALIIATGVRRRRLGIEGEHEFEGRGILRSGAGERESVRNRRVVIVGGGDAALENALILSEFAREVTVIHRRRDFSARSEFVELARKLRNVKFEFETVVERILGNDAVEHVVLKNVNSLESHVSEIDYILIRIGVEPNSDLLIGQGESDERGYLVVDSACRTSIPGVFVAGDLANPVSPTIATAVGMGAAAAKAAKQFLHSVQNIEHF